MTKFLIRFIFLIALFCIVFSIACCQKEEHPQVYGQWETIDVVGPKWDYNIQKDGFLCKTLPEYFPGTNFCYDYEVDGDTLHLYSATPEKWVFEFEGDNVAIVTAEIGSPQEIVQFIIRRK